MDAEIHKCEEFLINMNLTTELFFLLINYSKLYTAIDLEKYTELSVLFF